MNQEKSSRYNRNFAGLFISATAGLTLIIAVFMAAVRWDIFANDSITYVLAIIITVLLFGTILIIRWELTTPYIIVTGENFIINHSFIANSVVKLTELTSLKESESDIFELLFKDGQSCSFSMLKVRKDHREELQKEIEKIIQQLADGGFQAAEIDEENGEDE